MAVAFRFWFHTFVKQTAQKLTIVVLRRTTRAVHANRSIVARNDCRRRRRRLAFHSVGFSFLKPILCGRKINYKFTIVACHDAESCRGGEGGKGACVPGANFKGVPKSSSEFFNNTNTPYSNILRKYTLFQVLNHNGMALRRRLEKLVILVE